MLTFNYLCAKTPLLQTWPYKEKAGQLLVEQLQCFIKEVDDLYNKIKNVKYIKRQ